MTAAATLAQPEAPSVSPSAPRATCWPTELETLLLQAGLCTQSRAVAAWLEFCSKIEDIEALDVGCYRLFPLVAGNLQDARPEIPHRQRLTGTLRYAWTKNQRLFGQVLPLLRSLHGADVSTLLLKGAALTEFYRAQGGVRPMADVDILIRPENLSRAVALLRTEGFTADQPVTPKQLEDLQRFRHELTLRNATGEFIDLHWHLLADTRHLDAEDFFWRDAVPCRLAGWEGRTLHPADQLLHTCLHGAQWNEISPVRWLADAAILIRAGMDWPRLEEQARRLERVQPVRETILFLDQLTVDLPTAVVAHWRKVKITPFEKLEGGYRAFHPDSQARTKQLAWGYLRLTSGATLRERLRRLPAYMRQIHHFRAYSRRVVFVFHLAYFFLHCSSREPRLSRKFAA